jgi:outer membrane protein
MRRESTFSEIVLFLVVGFMLMSLLVAPQALRASERPAEPGTVLQNVPVTRDWVYRKALHNHPSIVIQAEKYTSSTEEVGIQRAAYFPTVSFDLDELVVNTPVLGLVTPGLEPVPITAFIPKLNQEIYEFGRRRNAVRAALFARSSAKWTLDEARLDVVWNAGIAFERIAMYQHLLEAALENERAAKVHLKQVKQRLKKGLAIWPDVTKAELYWQKSVLAVVQIRDELHKAQVDLGFAMGMQSFVPFMAVGKKLSTFFPGDPERLVRFALEHRPMIQAFERKDESQESLVHKTFDKHLPSLSAFATGFLLYGVPPSVSGAPSSFGLFLPTYQMGVSLSVPIFQGMKIIHETQSERAKYRSDVAETRLARIRVTRNVRKVWFDLRTQEQTVRLDRARLENAQANRDLIEKRYDRGLVDSVMIIEAQAEYISAKENLIAARYRYRMISDELQRQIGLMPSFSQSLSSDRPLSPDTYTGEK